MRCKIYSSLYFCLLVYRFRCKWKVDVIEQYSLTELLLYNGKYVGALREVVAT